MGILQKIMGQLDTLASLIKKTIDLKEIKTMVFSTLEMSAGSIAIMDTSLWHTTRNPPSKESRWSVFNMYGALGL